MKESLPLYRDFSSIHAVDPEYYSAKYDVKRGLRNADGTGVLAGVTNISNVHGYVVSEGDKVADRGRLSYRGYSINDLVDHVVDEDRFGFEETAYLLMAGELPTAEQLADFRALIDEQRDLPDGFTANYIMKPPTRDIMNCLSRSVLQLYAFDERAEEVSARLADLAARLFADDALTLSFTGTDDDYERFLAAGAALGRTLGFPTLNMAPIPPGSHSRPAVTGVFAVRIHGLGQAVQNGVASIGVKPTVATDGRWLLETHVFDWSGSAYGRIVKVEFVERLRGEKKFSGLDELKAAIESDADHARRILGCVRPQADVPLQGMNP